MTCQHLHPSLFLNQLLVFTVFNTMPDFVLTFRRPSRGSINEIIEANKIIEDKELRVRPVTAHQQEVWGGSGETMEQMTIDWSL